MVGLEAGVIREGFLEEAFDLGLEEEKWGCQLC